MKTLLWIYIIGCICGLLSYGMITLKMLGYCKRKGIKPPKKNGLEEICGFIRILLQSAIPIYHYLLFLSVLFYDSKKFEQIIQNKIDEANGTIDKPN